MNTASSTCTLSNPQTYDGSTPTSISDIFQFKTEDCIYSYASSAPATTTIPLFQSYIELDIAFFLFFILVFTIFSFLLDRIVGVRIRRNVYNTIGGASRGGKTYTD